jgi:hypothetical protein
MPASPASTTVVPSGTIRSLPTAETGKGRSRRRTSSPGRIDWEEKAMPHPIVVRPPEYGWMKTDSNRTR